MAIRIWEIRPPGPLYDVDEFYGDLTTLFSFKVNHGGFFTKFPNRMYVEGKVDYVDVVDVDEFSLNEMDEMLKEIGYSDSEVRFYHYKVPDKDLNFGLKALGNKSDVNEMLPYIPNVKLIDVFVEHHKTDVEIYSKSNVKIDEFLENDSFIDVKVELAYDDDLDYVDIHEDKVDKHDFNAYVDKDVEVKNEDDDIECEVDHEDFDIVSDEENETLLERALKKARKIKNKNSDEVKEPFFVGQQFSKRDEVKELVITLAAESRRQLAIMKNDNDRFRAVCHGIIPDFEEGSKTKEETDVDTKTVPTCPWVLHVTNQNNEGTWIVKTFINEHKCLNTREVRLCTVSWWAKVIESTVLLNPSIPLKALQDQVQLKYQIEVSKQKIFRAKTMATEKIEGDYRAQYALLREYSEELIRANPGTTVTIDVERECNPSSQTRQFRRIYICLGGLKAGFKTCGRNLLGLDGSFMKGPFPGQILTAVGIDSNNGIYHVAYALVEAETTNTWTWFLECLGHDLDLSTNSNFTFISDRQKGILPAVAKVFPCAKHRYCLRHIHENMKSKWRGELYKNLLWKCATSTTVQWFDKAMKEIQNEDQNLFEWLGKISAKHWSRAYFSGTATSDVLLNNICEVFNKQLSGGRDKPVITCLEYIREYLMSRIAKVHKVIAKCDGPLTPYATKVFEKTKLEANQCTVLWNGMGKYQVKGRGHEQYIVDMDAKTCTCRRWEITGIPCRHTVAVIWDNRRLDTVAVIWGPNHRDENRN